MNANGTPPSILVVEDEAPLRRFVVIVLKGAGYDVIEAASSVEALTVAAGATISLLVTDVVMPRVSGVELALQLHQTRPDLPVIFMTGYGAEVGAHMGLDVRVLGKPFTPNELRQAVAQALARSTATAA